MKRWGLLVAVLYLLALLALTVPVIWLAFVPGLRLRDALGLFQAWPYWAWLGVMFICQFCLLIAVPAHIVARYRNYCCAGFMTFIGLTCGIAVMLFAYGPAVFVLFAERWKRLHPKP